MKANNGHLTEAQAWREIARRVGDLHPNTLYLCAAIDDLGEERHLLPSTARRMRARVYEHIDVNPEDRDRAFIRTDDGDDKRGVRVLAALLLALETEDEQS